MAVCQQKAIEHVGLRPITLAQEVVEEFDKKYKGQAYRFHTTHNLESLVRRTRSSQFGDWENLIASPPLNLCSPEDNRSFLQFNLTGQYSG